MSEPQPSTREWHSLSDEEQTALRVAFGHHLDSLPPTCSLEAKVERFRNWLGERGIEFRDAG